jgi:hydrogenase maturation factor
MDPITGALERIGWLAVNVNANDIATFGVEPAFLFSCILLPEGSDKRDIETICVQMDKAARELGLAIAGGHCEVTPGLTNPIVVGCTIGIAENGKYVTAGEAKNGDRLILTKSAGIEGTAILASDREEELNKVMDPRALRSAEEMISQVSVVKDAIVAFKTGGVDAMHDPTEGGIRGGVYEMAEASSLGVKIIEEEIPIQPETTEICRHFDIDPLQLVSSGALLIAAKPKAVNKIIGNLRQLKIPASIIGDFVEGPQNRTLIGRNGKLQTLPKPASDHLWLALSRNRRLSP